MRWKRTVVCALAAFGLASLWAATPAVALLAGFNVDIHQDNPDIIANDFHIEGRIESGDPGSDFGNPPVLVDHIDDLFPFFNYSFTPDPSSDGNWYFFTADWWGADYPYCSILHLGLLFDVDGANVVIDLVGWWTVDGQRVSTGANFGYIPIPGFDVTDPEQRMILQNGNNDGGDDDGEIEMTLLDMDLAPIADQAQLEALLGLRPLAELRVGGLQAGLPWINAVNENGPIMPSNPHEFAVDSFFDVFFELNMPPTMGSLAMETPFTLPEGGFLVVRERYQFINNAGEPEVRWIWELHGADDGLRGCCMPDGSCILMPEEECPIAGGYVPPGGFCQGDFNGNNIDDACEQTAEYCPLPDDQVQVCLPLQTRDCVTAGLDELCLPEVVFLNQDNQVEAELCDCFIRGEECGPVTVREMIPNQEWEFVCEGPCPPGEECLIHLNGVSAGIPNINSNLAPVGVNVTCECVEEAHDYCPLPDDNLQLCAPLQTRDCVTAGIDDICLPEVLVVNPDGTVEAELCDCFVPGGDCGPITVVEVTPSLEYDLVCEGVCPPGEDCLIHINGVSTGMPNILSSQVSAGSNVTCECAESEEYCPLPSDQVAICAPLQTRDCVSAGLNETCLPLVAYVNGLGEPEAELCDCIEGDDCGPIKVVEVTAGQEWDFVCEGVCPPGEDCLVHIGGVSTGVNVISSTQVTAGDSITCACVEKPEDVACCLTDGSGQCIYTTQADCDAQGGFVPPGGMCLGDTDGDGVDDACQDYDYLFEFSLDIGSDTELSDPQMDGDEVFDPGDIYIWPTGVLLPGPTDGFKDDAFIWPDLMGAGTGFYDPWPDPNPPVPYTWQQTVVPVGDATYTPENYHEWFDLDGHDQVQFSLLEMLPGGTVVGLIQQYPDACIYPTEFLMVSYDDDMAPGWPANDVPVTVPSPAGVIYGQNPDEIMGVTFAAVPGLPLPIVAMYQIADEIGVHPNLAPNPAIEEEDDDVDSLDIVLTRDECPILLFTADHEATFMDYAGFPLDPGSIYERTATGPVQVIDDVLHLGIPEDADVDAFEMTFMENPEMPDGSLYLAILFSVDEDDPLTPLINESGGLNPNSVYVSFLTGYFFEVAVLEDDIDALTLWTRSLEQLPTCIDADVNCDGSVNGGDIAVVRQAANWLMPCPLAADPRTDVNKDNAVNGGDIAAIRLSGIWLTSTGPCVCPPSSCP